MSFSALTTPRSRDFYKHAAAPSSASSSLSSSKATAATTASSTMSTAQTVHSPRYRPPGPAHRTSGDIVGHRTDIRSDDFMTLDVKLKRVPTRMESHVPLDHQVPPPEERAGAASLTTGKKTRRFLQHSFEPEDIVRPYRPTKRLIHPQGLETQPPQSLDPPAVESPRPGKRVYPQAAQSVMSPNNRDTAAAVEVLSTPPKDLLGARKYRSPPPASEKTLDDRKPCLRVLPRADTNVIEHVLDRPTTAPSRLSKRMGASSGGAETTTTVFDVSRPSRRVIAQPPSQVMPAPEASRDRAPVFVETGYLQARPLKSEVRSHARSERLRSHGDIIGWTGPA